jgi:hypothetical protein
VHDVSVRAFRLLDGRRFYSEPAEVEIEYAAPACSDARETATCAALCVCPDGAACLADGFCAEDPAWTWCYCEDGGECLPDRTCPD